ncbi:unnamed protein product [Vitrella brassicaformis CCMP3155]|uniref:J domain-containing protein n=2 Tax=Vitrella brassicaformis TaxID=1169539 RepID=A0A0G4GDQ5_VITBC|nr:unnamed protein product [Vitrella brassicaformis CCMP3155]|eukprot:CEM27494.1 unnamed protein product [Vitrella brassicaformis CCMP3155]
MEARCHLFVGLLLMSYAAQLPDDNSLYSLLGVDPSASQNDIKRAFRRIARQLPPEAMSDGQLTQAYAILADPVRRRQYDAERAFAVERHIEDLELFRPSFLNGSVYVSNNRHLYRPFLTATASNGFRPSMRRPMYQRAVAASLMAQDLLRLGLGNRRSTSLEVDVSLEELYKGTTRAIDVEVSRFSPTAIQPRMQRVTINLTIPPGTLPGAEFRFPGQGDQIGANQPYNDIIMVVRAAEHPDYKLVDDSDVHTTVSIPLSIALAGGSISVKGLDGSPITVRLNSITRQGDLHVVHGKGFPIRDLDGQRGNLVIYFDIVFPSSLTERQKRQLRRILGN